MVLNAPKSLNLSCFYMKWTHNITHSLDWECYVTLPLQMSASILYVMRQASGTAKTFYSALTDVQFKMSTCSFLQHSNADQALSGAIYSKATGLPGVGDFSPIHKCGFIRHLKGKTTRKVWIVIKEVHNPSSKWIETIYLAINMSLLIIELEWNKIFFSLKENLTLFCTSA